MLGGILKVKFSNVWHSCSNAIAGLISNCDVQKHYVIYCF